MKVRDGRKAPFIWVAVATLEYLRANWSPDAGVRLGTGLSVYNALCELANEEYARATVHADSDQFGPSRADICERSGVSDKPVDKALRELERIGILRVERNNQGEGKRAGAVSAYTLYEPDQTSGGSPEVGRNQPAEKVRTTSGGSPEVPDQTSGGSPDGTNKGEEKQPKKEECAPTQPGSDFGVLPAAIGAPLRQAAQAKAAAFNPESIKRACDAFPDRDHAEEAEKFAAWHGAGGRGENAPLRVVAVEFKKWLKTSPPAERKPGRAPAASLGPVPPVAQLRERASEIESAWPAALEELRKCVRDDSSYRLWIEPLAPVGRDGNVVYLSAPPGVCAYIERRYTGLIAEVLAPHLGEVKVRVILDEPAEAAA